MTDLGAYAFVFVAGLITALATGLGALPFFVLDDIGDRWNVVLWGLASGIMLGASLFGLVGEGLAYGTPLELGVGVVAGVVLVVVAHEVIEGAEVNPRKYEEADYKKLLLVLGVLTVHSFPEGVAVGVSFAELGFDTVGGLVLFGTAVPLLAVFMTVAISVHNVPEGGGGVHPAADPRRVAPEDGVVGGVLQPAPARRRGDRLLLRHDRPAVPPDRLRLRRGCDDLPRAHGVRPGGARTRRGARGRREAGVGRGGWRPARPRWCRCCRSRRCSGRENGRLGPRAAAAVRVSGSGPAPPRGSGRTAPRTVPRPSR